MLHWFVSDGRIIFWDEHAIEMLLPQNLSHRSMKLSRLMWMGNAWSLQESELEAFLSIADQLRRNFCPRCKREEPCEHFGKSIFYWSAAYVAREEHAKRKEERKEEQRKQERRERVKSPFELPIRKHKPDKRESAAKILGLAWPCTRQDVMTAFRDAILRVHPDTGGSHSQAKEAIEAREILLAALETMPE